MIPFYLIIVGLFSCALDNVSSQRCFNSPKDGPICSIGTESFSCLGKDILVVPQNESNRLRSNLTIYCFASYPIDFDMTGTNLNENVRTSFTRGGFNTYTLVVSIVNLQAPRRFTFYKVGNTALSMSFFLIRPGDIAFPNAGDAVEVKSETEVITLPCIASNYFDVNTSLKLRKTIYKSMKSNQTFRKLRAGSTTNKIEHHTVTTTDVIEDEFELDYKTLSYSRSQGFLLNTSSFEKPYGDFSCIFKRPNATEERFPIKVLQPQNLVAEPNNSNLVVFQKGQVHLSCKHIAQVILVGIFNNETIRQGSSIFENTHLKFQAEFLRKDLNVGDKGDISCRNTATDKIIHQWKFETLDIFNNSKLKLKIEQSKVSCVSEISSPKISTIECYGETNCRIRLPCFLSGGSCTNLKFGEQCETGQSCIDFLRDDHFPQGIIKCSSADHIFWTYYVQGFDGKIYTDWRNAPASALIEINAPTERMYAGGVFNFVCRMSTFLSNGNVRWLYKRKNNDSAIYFKNKHLKTITTKNSYVMSEIKLDADVSHILCRVPIWDSADLWDVSLRISVENPEAPVIKTALQFPIFVKNQTERVLRCAAHGLPQPIITWSKSESNLSTEFTVVETNDEDNTKVLHFPRITPDVEGDYMCSATNIKGTATLVFKVAVKDPQSPRFNSNYINHTFHVGEREKILHCEVESYPRPELITWSFNGQMLGKGFSQMKTDAELKTIETLNFPTIKASMSGEYICKVTSIHGTAEQIHYLEAVAESSPVFGIIISAAVAILFLLTLLIFVLWCLRQAKREIRDLSKAEIKDFFEGHPDAVSALPNTYQTGVGAFANKPYNRDYEIPKENLKIDDSKMLGCGAYGMVMKGRVDGIDDFVAVKTVKPDSDVSYFKALLSELKIMIYLGKHANVVNLIGAYTENIRKRQLYIVVELCSHGSLESYLRLNRKSFVDQIENDTIVVDQGLNLLNNVRKSTVNTMWGAFSGPMKTTDLIRWSYEVAIGMDYLASKKVIHADLSTRNVLLHENGCAKITDFGLSRQLYDYTQYVKKQQEPLPWRWMAIESLRELSFSSHSDVWAYGVTMWEIFSLGDIPFPGRSWSVDFVDELIHGLRMNKPRYATSFIYNIMYDCWREDPEVRPQFHQLKERISSVLTTECSQDYAILDFDVEEVPILRQLQNNERKDAHGYLVPNNGINHYA